MFAAALSKRLPLVAVGSVGMALALADCDEAPCDGATVCAATAAEDAKVEAGRECRVAFSIVTVTVADGAPAAFWLFVSGLASCVLMEASACAAA